MKRTIRIFAPFLILFTSQLWSEEPPLPASLTVITQDDLIGRPYFSVADALTDITSLNIERIGSQGTRAVAKMRGTSSEKNVIVLIDGNDLSHAFDGRVDLSQIPINIVERIEISRGGGPVSFGARAAAGTINVITMRPEKKGITTRIGTGVGRDGVKHSHGQFRGRSYLGDLTYLGSIEESKGFMSNEDSKGTNHFVNLSRSFNGKGYWAAEYFFQESKVGLGQGTPVPFSQWNSDLEQESSEPFRLKKEKHQHVKASVASPRLGWGTLQFSLTHRIRESDILLNDGGTSAEDKENRTLVGELKWQNKSYEIGLRRSQYRRNLFSLSENNAFENVIYVFNKFSWGHWTVVPGINGSYHSEAKSALDSRVAVLFNPERFLSFSATAQSAHRAPNFDELFHSSGVTSNPDLEFEKSRSADLGVMWSPIDNITFTLSGFQSYIDDVIEPDANNRFVNAGREKTSGAETQLQLELGEGMRFRHLLLKVQGTAQQSKRNGLASPMTPKKYGSVSLTQYLPRSLSLTNTVRYQGEQWELLDEKGLKVPSTMLWDLRLGCKIHSADLYFEARNLARRRYADTIDMGRLAPQAERTFWAGLSIRFEN